MSAGSAFHGGNSGAHFPLCFEKPEHKDGIAQIAEVDIRPHVANYAVLAENENVVTPL